MITWDLFWGCKDGSIFANPSVSYTTLTKQNKNHVVISIDKEKKQLTKFIICS